MAKKSKIYLIEDVTECRDAKTGKAIPFYVYHNADECGRVVRRDASQATLKELAELCDHDAENCNAHDFCGVHERLANVIRKKAGPKVAVEILLEIAQLRGLHGMMRDE